MFVESPSLWARELLNDSRERQRKKGGKMEGRFKDRTTRRENEKELLVASPLTGATDVLCWTVQNVYIYLYMIYYKV